MNLPGVRRIEALISVLGTKQKEEIALVSASLPTRAEIKRVVDVEFGIADTILKYEDSVAKAQAYLDEINSVTGEGKQLKQDYNYRYRHDNSTYTKRVEALIQERVTTVTDDIKRKYSEKESALWLVENIEQAKAIVYGA